LIVLTFHLLWEDSCLLVNVIYGGSTKSDEGAPKLNYNLTFLTVCDQIIHKLHDGIIKKSLSNIIQICSCIDLYIHTSSTFDNSACWGPTM